jgi:predicted Zn-dependent protease
MGLIEDFEQMLLKGQEGALIRFSLGNAYLKENRPQMAVEHLRIALTHDPEHSAAWKLLGKALAEARCFVDSMGAFDQGIKVAEGKGDKQAAKEMRVFRRRVEKRLAQEVGSE